MTHMGAPVLSQVGGQWIKASVYFVIKLIHGKSYIRWIKLKPGVQMRL